MTDVSFLPWWGWLLVAIVLFLAIQFTDEKSRVSRAALFGAMVLAGLIGIFRFVKWVWKS